VDLFRDVGCCTGYFILLLLGGWPKVRHIPQRAVGGLGDDHNPLDVTLKPGAGWAEALVQKDRFFSASGNLS